LATRTLSETFQVVSFVGFSMPAWRALHVGRKRRPCVAQLFKLLYRRSATAAALGKPRDDQRLSSRPPIENRRNSRIKSDKILRYVAWFDVLAQPLEPDRALTPKHLATKSP
jgi:hypothetical protein